MADVGGTMCILFRRPFGLEGATCGLQIAALVDHKLHRGCLDEDVGAFYCRRVNEGNVLRLWV
jgi:hypothetical protein